MRISFHRFVRWCSLLGLAAFAQEAIAQRDLLSAPIISEPVEHEPQDGRVDLCMSRRWSPRCDAVVAPANIRSVRIPLAGRVSVQAAGYRFDAQAIARRRTGGSEAAVDGGTIWLGLTKVSPGCAVTTDGFSLRTPISRFWDSAVLSDDNRTLTWNMVGGDAATFDAGSCPQVESPVNFGFDLRIRLVGPNSISAEVHLTFSTLGNPPRLAPLVLTNTEQLDLAFVIDTTGSMWDDIDMVKTAAIDLLETAFEEAPDARIAVVEYKDFPFTPFGGSADYPFRVVEPFSTDHGRLLAGIDALRASGGGDTPESVYSGLIGAIESRTDGEGRAIGLWRNDVKKSILLFGDAGPHDPEPVTGFTQTMVLEAAARLGVPPVDPTERAAFTSAAASNGALAIYAVQAGADPAARTAFESLSEGTGGAMFTAGNAGEVIAAIDEALGAIQDAPPPPSPIVLPPIQPPAITADPLLTHLPGCSAAIAWSTDQIATSVVELGTAPGVFDEEAGLFELVTEHQVVLAELRPDTEYSYRVSSSDAAGNTAESASSSFVACHACCSPSGCDDGDPCTTESCDENNFCRHEPGNFGGTCSRRGTCNLSGECEGAALRDPCTFEGYARSLRPLRATALEFQNPRAAELHLYLLDAAGARVEIAGSPLASGAVLRHPAFVGEYYLVADEGRACLGIFEPDYLLGIIVP